jgi:anti-sigma B factor antagonist
LPDIKVVGDVTIVRLSGPRIGLESREALYELVDARGPLNLILNLEEIPVLTSSPIGLLVSLRNRVQALGGSVALCHVAADVREILRLTSVDGLFPIFGTEAEAIESSRLG